MKHINIHNLFAAAILIALSQPAVAVKDADSVDTENASRQTEISRKSIRVASDGTGIIKNLSCSECDFKILKVTAETRTYLGDVEIKTADVVRQGKASVGVADYALDSNTVYEIRFSR